MAQNGTLSAKQRAAIVALMQARDVRAAALACGIPARTLFRWLSMPAFQIELKAAAQRAIDLVTRRLAELAGTAVDVLETEMADIEATPGVRVRAANVVLARLLSLKKLSEFEDRIAALEKSIGGQGQ